MGKSLAEVDAMPGPDLLRWSAWFARNPPLADRLDALAAMLAAEIRNGFAMLGGSKRRWKLQDFLIWKARGRRITDPRAQQAFFHALALAMGAKT